MKANYPYDPDATLPSNRVTDSVDINVFPNAFKVVVPESAPFYRLDLEVYDSSNRLLIEGLDYYLGFYSSAISEATGKAVYGGIMLFDTVTSDVTLRSVGGPHMVPQSEVGRYLTDPALVDPRNTDWSELQRYPTTVAPVDKPENIDEAIQQDVVVKALDGVRQKIVDKVGDLDEKYLELISEIEAVAIKIYDHNLHSHVPHQHAYTRADLNALGVDETAVDAIKAYGLTLQEVVDEMVTFGINQSRIDSLLTDNLADVIKGRLHVNSANNLVFQHESGNVKLTLDDPTFEMETSAGEVIIEADSESVNAGIGLEIGAGFNVLLVPSNGATQGQNPSFNGKVLITADNILDFIHKPSSGEANVHSTSTATVEFQGRGVASAPFKANAIPPLATSAVTGLWKVTDSLLLTGDGYGISQWAVTQIKNSLDGYVDKSYTINGEEFGADESVTLTKTHLGLGSAQNTAPADKPVTTALTNATAGKALEAHTHEKADLKNVPVATASVEGIGMLHATIDDTTDKFATPSTGLELEQLIDGVEHDVSGRVKSGAADATFYGGNGYLPVPALGNYAGYADTRTRLHSAILFEKNQIVCLRNGGDGLPDSEAVYYWYGTKTDQAITDIVSSSLKYHPAFLDVKYPGFKVHSITQSTAEALLLLCRNFDTGETKRCLVLTLGTMDMSKHTIGCDIEQPLYDGPAGGAPYMWELSSQWDRICVDGASVYFLRSVLHNTDHYLHLGKLNIADIEAADILSPVPMQLHGTDYNGTVREPSSCFMLLERGSYHNTEPNGSISFSSDERYWSGSRNTSHGPARNFIAHAENGEMRVRTESSIYLSNSFTSHWGGVWHTSYHVNLVTGEVSCDHNCFPIEITAAGVRYPNGELRHASMPGFAANNVAHSNYAQKGFIGYATHSNIQRPPTLYVDTIPDDFDKLEQLKYNKFNDRRRTIYSGSLAGVHGSGVSGNFRGTLFLDDEDYLVTYQNNQRAYLCVYDPDTSYGYDEWGGYGPTNDRASYPMDKYHGLSRIPRICKGDQVYLSGSQHRTRGERVPKSYDAVLKQPDMTDIMTVNNAVWDAVEGFVTVDLAGTVSPIDDPRLISHYYTLTFFDVGGLNEVAINYQSIYAAQDDKSGPKIKRWRSWHTTFSTQMVGQDTEVISIDLPNALDTHRYDSSGSWSRVSAQYTSGQCTLIVTDTEGVLYGSENLCTYGTIGGSGQNSHLYRIHNGAVVYNSTPGFNTSYTEHYMAYLKEKKEVIFGGYLGNAEFLGGATYSTAAITVALPTSVTHGSKTAEGWLIYFTQVVDFYSEQKLYSVPKADFDLSALYAANHKNRTFYIHVDVTDGTPKYTIDTAVKQDTPTRLWIGRVVTNDERIIVLDVERARRLGNIAPLLQHAHNAYAHNYDPSTSLIGSEYGLLENKGMVHDFDVVSFKDVFDTWYRFSHNTSGVYPANAEEANAWAYFENDDCVECTTNSGTYIGFISDELAGDYVFNTVVTSINQDDDCIMVILGAFKQGDIDNREHTLSLQVNTGGLGTATPFVCIDRNFAQSDVERIHTLDPTSDGANTGEGWANTGYYETFHIYARREKNRLKVFVGREKLLDPNGGFSHDSYRNEVKALIDRVSGYVDLDFEKAHYFEADLDLSVVAPDFARPCRFGYGAYSQSNARYWNIERPLDRLDGFYSSEQMILESLEQADGNIKKIYGESLQSAIGDKYSLTNWAFKGFPKAVVHEFDPDLSPGNYPRPEMATYVAPTQQHNPANGIVTLYHREVEVPGTVLKIEGVADDTASVFIEGVDKGVCGTRNTVHGEHTVLTGENRVLIACTNTSAGSPSFAAFRLTDHADARVAVSDKTWYCDDGEGGYDNLKGALVTYEMDSDMEDLFNVYAKVASDTNQPTEIAPVEYYPQPLNKTIVRRFVDVTHGDVCWEVTLIKKTI